MIEKTAQGGSKHSKGKLPFHLITPEMMTALAEGLQLGLDKGYGARNWEDGLNIHECSLASGLRHIFKYIAGEDYNIETNFETGEELDPVHHLVCAFINLGMAVTQIKRGRDDLDDRPGIICISDIVWFAGEQWEVEAKSGEYLALSNVETGGFAPQLVHPNDLDDRESSDSDVDWSKEKKVKADETDPIQVSRFSHTLF